MTTDPLLQHSLDHMEGGRSIDTLHPLLAEDATFHYAAGRA